jgi:hypothetical protein
MKIGIRFCDNDFGTIVTSFLSLLPQLTYGNTYDKELLVNTFNLVAPELARLSYITNHGAKYDTLIKYNEYLQLDLDDIFIGDEVNDFLELECSTTTGYWYNSEFHYIDLTTGDITSV